MTDTDETKPAGFFTDSPEQARVIGAPAERDALVVAGAGSGKTYTMTRRIISLIEQGVPPERILGLTFTKKAAAELLSRVSAAVMAHVARSRAGREADVATGMSANRAFVKPEVLTYDAFFQSIVRQYGLLVGFDQNTQPLSEAGAWQIASDVVERHMDLLVDRDFGGFTTVVKAVMELSNAIGGSMIGPGCDTIGDAVARVRDWDAAMLRRIAADIGGEDIPDRLATVKGKEVKQRKAERDDAYAARVQEERRKALHVWHLNSLVVAGNLRETIERREILLTLVEDYARSKRRMGMAEFSDFTLAAYQLVTRFASIGEHCRRRYSHVLLDEYQDTSTTQAALIATLFHPGLGAKSSAVTAVGDPFQSIYAWRGASPGAFRIFQQDFGMGPGERPYSLSVTRRNSRIILDAANNLTAPLRGEHRPRRPSSSRMHEVDVEALSPMDTAPLGTLGVLGYATLGQEIDAVARFVRTVIERHGVVGRTAGSEDSAERSHGPHVAVLFRAKTAMSQFAQGLERAGLTTLTVGYSALLDRPEVRDVLALLHVVVDSTDTAALMRLLATPRFGISAAGLRALASIADDENTAYQFRSLVQAGLVSADTPRSQRRTVVHEHRDTLANGVFLADVLARRDLASLLAAKHTIDGHDRDAVIRVGIALRRVQAAMHHALGDIVRTAVEALDVDIDMVVAQAVDHPEDTVSPTLAHSSMDSLLALIDTYARELVEGRRPGLKGFMAWVDALGSVEDVAPTVPDADVDVVLMTIHQSKGLEWDAVAVVGMQDKTFPSNQGDSLTVELDGDHAGGMHQGRWQVPEYHETAKTWLEHAQAVPVPVRADAGILPRFPHDAAGTGDSAAGDTHDPYGLDALDTVERLNAEINGNDIAAFDDANGIEREAGEADFLSQHEEYGRRLHADERRLAYVALTRAREDALLTYHQNNAIARDTSSAAMSKSAAKPSNFWQEVRDCLMMRPDVAKPSAGDEQVPQDSLTGRGVAMPEGFFVGERATAYMRSVVDDAWSEPVDESQTGEPLPWPIGTSPRITEMLSKSAGIVRAAMNDATVVAAGTADAADAADAADTSGADGGADAAPQGPLLLRARMLTEDRYLMPWSLSDGSSEGDFGDLDAVVRRRGARILARMRHNVTALQASAGLMDHRQERAYLLGLVRPVPQIASPAAQAGTRFHAWAERFVNAFGAQSGLDEVDLAVDGVGQAVAQANTTQTREELLEGLREAERTESDTDPDERRILLWERRLASSRWARRRPMAAERQIVVALPQLDGQIVVGKLDAVFYGGLDDAVDDATADHEAGKNREAGAGLGIRTRRGADQGGTQAPRTTIIDWKTGARPRTPQDVEAKLRQLDMYRLLLSAIDGVPLDSIDATLYYLSESEEDRRELHARGKTEEEIVAELSSGIPMTSDDD
ncbi:MAG: UvrD-helicase domain-containing protein [Bifidobacterium mongoliense]|jgi:DNA helicase-2/ATP-dependent DNA helicase PcrA|uniref:UvrD-helicase domain-containing protein n=1 Tax=Bifidobacterium mongoliense TaxID=518643 RepID=UPI002F3509AF